MRLHFSIAHRCSIGFRSHDWPSHSKTLKGCLDNRASLFFLVCLGSLSCRDITLNVFMPYFENCHKDWLPISHDIHIDSFYLLNLQIKLGQIAIIQPQTIMEPPPRFSVFLTIQSVRPSPSWAEHQLTTIWEKMIRLSLIWKRPLAFNMQWPNSCKIGKSKRAWNIILWKRRIVLLHISLQTYQI